MARIKGIITAEKPSRRWRRLLLAAIPIVVILAVLVIWQPWSPGSQSVLAKAQAAIEGLQSYRVSLIHTSDAEGEVSEVRFCREA